MGKLTPSGSTQYIIRVSERAVSPDCIDTNTFGLTDHVTGWA